MNDIQGNTTIQLKLGDIIQLYSSMNEEINNKIYIITYIDTNKIVLNNPEKIEPLILIIDENGIFVNVKIEQIALLNRSDKDGYLAQNNLNISDLLELIFIEDSGSVDKIYGQITNIEEDMMELKLYPSNDVIYIDFAYKGIPLELNLRAINIINNFPDISEPELSSEIQVQDEQPLEEQPLEEQPLEEQPLEEQPTIIDTIEDRAKQLFISADQLFLGAELGEFQQDVQLGEKERRYGIDTQLNDLLEELISVIPNEERNTRVLNNINNMINKFKQLRENHSEFDEFNNANKKPTDSLFNIPLIKTLQNFEKNINWILPIIKTKKQLYNFNIEDELLTNIDASNDFSTLTSLNDFIDNHYRRDIFTNQNRYDNYLRFLNTYFKSTTNIERNTENKILTDNNISNSLNVIIDNLNDFYSEVATGVSKNQIELSKHRFSSTVLIGDIKRTQLIKGKIGDSYIEHIDISNGDKVQLTSFMILPEKIVSNNSVLLNTKIIDKTNSSTNIDYYNYLRNSTSIVSHYINNEQTIITNEQYNLKNKLTKHIIGNIKQNNNILHIEPSQGFIDAFYELPNDDKNKMYTEFLKQFLPSNTEIINEIFKNKHKNNTIKGLTSIYEFIIELGSFMVDKDNFTYTDMVETQKIIDLNIKNIKQKIIKRSDELNILISNETSKIKNQYTENTKNVIQLLLSNIPLVDDNDVDDGNNLIIINIIRTALENYYGITNTISSSEIMHKIYNYDNGQFLNLCLSYLTLGLHSTIDLNNELNSIDKIIQSEIEQETQPNKCQNVKISKKYTSLEELNSDNDKIIYYDNQYDDTQYDIIDIYREQQSYMEPPQFKDFLKNKLMENIGLSNEMAMKEADSMIDGRRIVEEGDVAILDIQGDKTRYYSRVNSQWKRNNDIKFDVQTGNLLCVTKQDCYEVKNKCVDEDLAQQLIKTTNIQSMLNIFDIKQEKTRDKLRKNISYAIRKLYENKNSLDESREMYRRINGVTRKNIANTTLQQTSQDNIQKSPYSKLFQAIMGQEDFVQKQHNIVKFVNQFTYDVDDNYWFLCIKTSQKLVPKFLFKLAKAFISNDDYFLIREQVCSSQGVLSDDGDKWVDKYSGYVIKMVDSSAEEGYDGQGYKLQTRDMLESTLDTIIQQRQQDLLTETLQENKDGVLQFKDSDFIAPYSDIVLKIVNSLNRSMGLDLQQHKPFIVNNVLRFNSINFSTKEKYDKNAVLMKKQKNISLPSFEIALNLNIIILTCCFVILAIQLAKPTMNTKKNVPGCFKYFKGFPLEENGDNGSLVYVACVVSKIKNNTSLPWKALGKTRIDGLVKKMFSKFEKQLLNDKQITDAIKDKREWAILHQEEEIEEPSVNIDSTLQMWNTFKPSLDINYNINGVSPVSDEFKNELLSDIKKGNKSYHTKVNTLSGKIIEQSNFYKNNIHNIVREMEMILKNTYQEPYMQNYFGDTLLTDGPLDTYLISKNEMLNTLKQNIKINEKILEDLRLIQKSPMMNPFFDTRKELKDDLLNFNEETIYKYFIKQCHFSNNIPNDAIISRICKSKPDGFNSTLPIEEQISFLKSTGHQYSIQSLNELLKVQGERNLINKELFNVLYDNNYYIFNGFIKYFNTINDNTPLNKYIFDETINKNIERLFSLNLSSTGYIDEATFNKINKDKGILRELKNNLLLETELITQNIINYSNSHTSTSRKNKKQFEDLIGLFDTMNGTILKKYQNLRQLLYLACIVFPNMIINNADFSNITLPKHWGLSELHSKDVKTILLNFYQGFKYFYSEKEDTEQENVDEITNVSTMFKRVMMLCKTPLKNLYFMVDEMPMNNQLNINGQLFIIDERFYELFIKYIFIKTIDIYIKSVTLINDRSVILQKYEKSRLGVNDEGEIEDNRKFDPITETEISEFMNQQMSDEDIVYNDDISLLELMHEYLINISPLLIKYSKNSMLSYDDIYKKVIASRENEKNTITRTLKDMSDEEREIQNLFKGHKLESWGKGLTKGLTRYVKENYDDERSAMEKRLEYERKVGAVDISTQMNMEIFMDNIEYENLIDEEVDEEVYNMDHLGSDDDYGDLDGDEFY